MNQNIIKGLLVAAIWCSNILVLQAAQDNICLLYTSPSPRD